MFLPVVSLIDEERAKACLLEFVGTFVVLTVGEEKGVASRMTEVALTSLMMEACHLFALVSSADEGMVGANRPRFLMPSFEKACANLIGPLTC